MKKRISYPACERLRKLVHDSESTQRDFAKSVGLSLSGLTTILGGKSPVSRTLALAVELIHNIRADWILTGDGAMRADLVERLPLLERMLLNLHKQAIASPGELLAIEILLEDSFRWADRSRRNKLIRNLRRLNDGLARLRDRHEKLDRLEKELRHKMRDFIGSAAKDRDRGLAGALIALLTIHYYDGVPLSENTEVSESEWKFIARIRKLRKRMRELYELSMEERQLLEELKSEPQTKESHGDTD
jgi:hypothetical protein